MKRTKLYKLTDENNQTKNATQWGENVTHTADGKSKELCNDHWLHAYTDPILAVMIAPAHVQYGTIKMWEAEGDVGLEKPDKVGCTRLTTLREVPLPEVTTAQRVRFACLVAREVYDLWKEYDKNGVWLKWYEAGWPADAAAARAAYAAYDAYAACAAARAADAACAAARAADAAAARAAYAAYAACAAARAADAAADAAYAAAAAGYVTKLDLAKLAHDAMNKESEV